MRETAIHAFLVFMFYVVYIYAVFILGNIPYLHAASLNKCTCPGARVAQYSSGLQADGQDLIFGMGKIFCFSPQHPYRLLPTHPASYPVGKMANADSPPSVAEVKNDGAIPPLLHMSLWHGA
jgi:hypothetical protein